MSSSYNYLNSSVKCVTGVWPKNALQLGCGISVAFGKGFIWMNHIQENCWCAAAQNHLYVKIR